jgi:hypothetical protein
MEPTAQEPTEYAYSWPLLPLDKGSFLAWAKQKGPTVAGIAYTYHACPLSNAIRDLFGWEEVKTDYNTDYGVGWVIHDEQVFQLPDWAYRVCLVVDRSRARPTGVRLLAWADASHAPR